MLTPERTAFFINKRARPEAKTTVIHLAQKISESTLTYLNGVALDLDEVNTAVVAGGDGRIGIRPPPSVAGDRGKTSIHFFSK